MATEQADNPLLSLSREKQQTLVDLVEDGDIDSIAEETGLSRRQVLYIGGGLLASAGVGGITADQIVQAVEADASTTDGDGNVGLPGDRVDVYADGIDATSLSTDGLEFPSGNYTDVLSNRSDNTWEQNNSNYPIHVLVQVDSDGSAASIAQLRLHENDTKSGNIIAIEKAQAADSANSTTVSATASLIVGPGNYYKANVFEGSISRWYEAEIGK